MTERILSISGLRGVIGDGLDPGYLVRFASALGTMAQEGKVVVTSDGRSTGPMIRHAVTSALMATGCRVVDAGIAATPTCGVLVRGIKADAGLQITASHNPIQWNGLKPFSRDGSVFDSQLGAQLLQSIDAQSFHYVGWDRLGIVETMSDAFSLHLERVLALVEVESIEKRHFKVVLDCNHGSGAVGGLRLLEALGCEVCVLGGTPDGRFEHPPEPLRENLSSLCDVVRQQGADVGFAQDPDADRLAVVDGTGRYLGEELTLALCADFVLARTPGSLVVNGSTSRVNADVADRHGCSFHRSHVGEANVVAKMKEVGAILGGEGNGGVIEPKVGYVRDSFVGMAYLLAGIAASERTLGEWADALPRYAIVKDKVRCPRERVEEACNVLEKAFSDASPQRGDGLRLDWEDRWVQIRASNTEPIARVIAEAPTEDTAKSLCDQAMQIVRDAI